MRAAVGGGENTAAAAVGGGPASASPTAAGAAAAVAAAVAGGRDDLRPTANAITSAIPPTTSHVALIPGRAGAGASGTMTSRASAGGLGRALATITPQRGQAGVVTSGAPQRGQSIAPIVPRPPQGPTRIQ